MKKDNIQSVRNELVQAWIEKAENDFGFAKIQKKLN